LSTTGRPVAGDRVAGGTRPLGSAEGVSADCLRGGLLGCAQGVKLDECDPDLTRGVVELVDEPA